MGWWHLRLSAKILALLRLSANFFQLGLTFFLPYLRLTVKIFQFLRLSTKFLAVLRLSVNPIETLLTVTIILAGGPGS